jgi:hypothetical protein
MAVASFEASLREAPQDEEGYRMAAREVLILRCLAQQGLEGRRVPPFAQISVTDGGYS